MAADKLTNVHILYTHFKELKSDDRELVTGTESVDHCARLCIEDTSCDGFVFDTRSATFGNCWFKKGNLKETTGSIDEIISGICRPDMLTF